MWTPTDTSKESSRRDLSKTALFGIDTLLVVEQASLESQSRGCAETPILTGRHHIQSEYGDEEADAGRDCRNRLARPNSQA